MLRYFDSIGLVKFRNFHYLQGNYDASNLEPIRITELRSCQGLHQSLTGVLYLSGAEMRERTKLPGVSIAD